ncbi:ABC transporter substrate-binding protein [Ancylobacter mangrovi]|uniref:ABC transporter substrate-binding protein n=1 Tax=Ancylobacter mangrovi TaxID=2972472 RepID=A0A9X2PFZ8_9HYPH|nr:ABC transporter substrate-binding protein [Ancylobacter mangrovi]MCS0497215.1 ABC transporter substrate-binding protein [Ancylobacter mangrovi]MCS0505039.1 ABC transporter substrate-binding protein [Ancylobacter mangrovi]
MNLTRRRLLQSAAGAGAAGLVLSGGGGALAAEKERLSIVIQGFSLAIHIPEVIALREGLAELGYPEPKIDRIESMQVITQSIVAGSANAGDSDVVTAMLANSLGADVRLTGLVYNSTSQVFVVNADMIKSYDDFKNTSNAIALNSRGDFIYVLLSGVLNQHGINIDDTTIVEMGGSGSRMRALLSGRVAAVPVHFDQAATIVKQGNYKVLIEPWKAYKHWYSEAWLVPGKWVDDKENFRAIVDLNKATIQSFRRANKDYEYFAAGFRKYATVAKASEATDEELKPVWEKLSKDINAWPNDGEFKREYFEELIPVYEKAGAIKGKPDLNRFIDTRFVDQALQELG